MSARNQQSDTSRVVKNPLLSAVPYSIDDFVNNTILLPAAEIPPVEPETHLTEENNGKSNSNVCLLKCKCFSLNIRSSGALFDIV